MSQKQSAPAQASVNSTDALHGNAQAKVLADKANAALEHLISPAITPKLSELPTVEARLMALADAIERQELVKHGIGFNMGPWRDSHGIFTDQLEHACGTTACIAGWAAILEEPNASGDSYIESLAQKILGITDAQAQSLFYAHSANSTRPYISAACAIAVIRDFAKSGSVRWHKFDNEGNPN